MKMYALKTKESLETRGLTAAFASRLFSNL